MSVRRRSNYATIIPTQWLHRTSEYTFTRISNHCDCQWKGIELRLFSTLYKSEYFGCHLIIPIIRNLYNATQLMNCSGWMILFRCRVLKESKCFYCTCFEFYCGYFFSHELHRFFIRNLAPKWALSFLWKQPFLSTQFLSDFLDIIELNFLVVKFQYWVSYKKYV